jgi:hypothetical protein
MEVHGVLMNHESNTFYFIFWNVSQASMVNMKAQPLIKITCSWKVLDEVQSGHCLFQGIIWEFTSYCYGITWKPILNNLPEVSQTWDSYADSRSVKECLVKLGCVNLQSQFWWSRFTDKEVWTCFDWVIKYWNIHLISDFTSQQDCATHTIVLKLRWR